MHGVARRAGEVEMRECRDCDCEDEENGPREESRVDVGLIDAHPSKVGAKAVQFVVGVREESVEGLSCWVSGSG